MASTGLNNAVTDVEGLIVGHYTDIDAVCGVTTVICPEGAGAIKCFSWAIELL